MAPSDGLDHVGLALLSPFAPSASPSATPSHGPTDGVRLRPWQRDALAKLQASSSANFLAVATPGAGKTTFALTAARRALVARAIRRVVIVVPTRHLKHQWALAAERLDIHLDPRYRAPSSF